MSIHVRTATEADLPAMFASDSRAFGFTYEQQDIDDRRSIIDPERFHLAIDAGKVVGAAGVYAFEMIVLFNRGQMLEALQASASCFFVVGALAMGLAVSRFFSPR